MSHETVEDLLADIKAISDVISVEYPHHTVQIQIHPTTLNFIGIGLSALSNVDMSKAKLEETKVLFGHPVVINKYLKGRFAIAVLVHEEKLWKSLGENEEDR